MIHQKADSNQKGWYFGPWNSDIEVPIGYANEGIDLPHYHEHMFEIYLVARGTSTILVNDSAIDLEAGDAIAVEPGESHTFLKSSADYFHFVIQTPFVRGDKVVIQEDR